MSPREDSPYQLLVEGSDDRHSILHLLTRHGVDWDNETTIRPYVKEMGSIEKLLSALPVALKSRHERIGVVVDANSNLPNRWAQLRGSAGHAGVELPASPYPEGTIVPGFRPGSEVGFWLMPDNSQPGNLESFLSRLIPEGDALWPYAGEVVGEARTRGARCKEKDHLKGALHTWLAWQVDPGLPFGTALRAKVFQHDTPDAVRFVSWFRRLFG
ncbi:MAG TPA: DUF3226 domain-containing protein [Thermoanaerobaculia bacterium]|jgi:hypothetical protein|nr:DUF3226 domain-containing protein [Thermoanaerobaculia bacterium]